METLFEANDFFLAQAERLLKNLDDVDFSAADHQFFGSSIGQHLRHCLDHYASFLEGLPGEHIDYDERERGTTSEFSVKDAAERVAVIRKRLDCQSRTDLTAVISVKVDCGSTDDGWQQSTVGRELQFLVGHTVHHYAMINGIALRRGIRLENNFGVAPATVAYRSLAKID